MVKVNRISEVVFVFTTALVLAFAPSERASGSDAHRSLFGISPDNSSATLLSMIRSAKQTILVNIYEFKEERIADALIERIQLGVSVQILIEGQPFPSYALDAKSVTLLRKIQAAMRARRATRGRHGIFVLTAADKSKRRFVFDHGKYLVIDSTSTYVASENFSGTAYPLAGRTGNRGWMISIEDPALAAQMTHLFMDDSALKYGDVWDATNEEIPEAPKPPAPERPTAVRNVPPLPMGRGSVDSARIVVSPGSMPGIEAFVESAKTMLRVEQASLPHLWRANPSPWVSKLIEVASRATHPVKTQVLLNDESVFELYQTDEPKPPKPNERAARFINEIALCKKIPIEAKIVDVKKVEITYIHNKGMIADLDQVFVSSINGTQNSITNNREVALHVKSKDAAHYYARAFDFDWKSSTVKPGINNRRFTDYEISQCEGIVERSVSVSPIFSWAWSQQSSN